MDPNEQLTFLWLDLCPVTITNSKEDPTSPVDRGGNMFDDQLVLLLPLGKFSKYHSSNVQPQSDRGTHYSNPHLPGHCYQDLTAESGKDFTRE